MLPSELRTREWDAAHAAKIGTPDAATLGWCKERAYFMAAVTRAEQLEEFRAMAAEVASGRVSPAEARQKIREWLAATGYQAKPGQEGTLKDLGSTQRLKVSIDTNVELARGWAQRKTSMANYVRPAQMLYRASQARQPRDWRKKWAEAAEAVGWEGVSRTHEFVALKTSPIWRALSRFDQPYPPFDFGSKMRVRSVSLKDAQAAGLLTEPEDVRETQEEQRRQALAGMNESVECTPQVSTRELRAGLSRVLKGLAEWKGDTLVMADPNGTRHYPPEEIGRVITAPLPKGFDNRQAAAVDKWVDNNKYYYPKEKGGRATMDERDDLTRLVDRIEPTAKNGEDDASAETVYRGLTNADKETFDDLLRRVRREGYGVRPGYIAESWTVSEIAAAHFADSKYPVVLVCNKYSSRKRIDVLYDYLPDSSPDVTKPKRLEGESLFPESSRFRFIGQEKRGNVLYIHVEELNE